MCVFVCSHELIHPDPPADPKGWPCSDSPSPVTLDTFNPTCLPCQPPQSQLIRQGILAVSKGNILTYTTFPAS